MRFQYVERYIQFLGVEVKELQLIGLMGSLLLMGHFEDEEIRHLESSHKKQHAKETGKKSLAKFS